MSWRMNGCALVGGLALGLVALEAPAQAVSAEDLEWSWNADTQRKWYVNTDVVLPSYLWVAAEKVKEARLFAFRLQVVMTCGQASPLGKKSWDVVCDLDDISIQGAALTGDRGNLQPILDEADEHLTGAQLQVRFRKDGRITNVDLEGVAKDNRRLSVMHDALRVMLSRAVAGFDLQLPRKGYSVEGIWPQYESLLLAAPTNRGSSGSAEVAHLVRSNEDGLVIIETAGHAMISPPTDGIAQNFYDTELSSVAVFDGTSGMMRERVWSSVGEPTASSAVAEGGQGNFYGQKGKILYLGDGVPAPVLDETREVDGEQGFSTAIGSFEPLGSKP